MRPSTLSRTVAPALRVRSVQGASDVAGNHCQVPAYLLKFLRRGPVSLVGRRGLPSVDGDGDLDVLSASALDDTVAWYENLGSLAFSEPRVIDPDAAGAWDVYAADLDGDGDSDVLPASRGDDRIAWYENLGGGAFS